VIVDSLNLVLIGEVLELVIVQLYHLSAFPFGSLARSHRKHRTPLGIVIVHPPKLDLIGKVLELVIVQL